jgi:hypothetical protein
MVVAGKSWLYGKTTPVTHDAEVCAKPKLDKT